MPACAFILGSHSVVVRDDKGDKTRGQVSLWLTWPVSFFCPAFGEAPFLLRGVPLGDGRGPFKTDPSDYAQQTAVRGGAVHTPQLGGSCVRSGQLDLNR